MSIVRNSIFAAALAASAVASATPALADGYRRHGGGGDDAAIAIGAGIVGLAIGAIIASSDNDRDRDRYYSGGYGSDYGRAPGYAMSWQYRDGWYWDGDGRRHSRREYNRYRRHSESGRGYDRDDQRRGYDRDQDDRRRGY